MAPWLANSFPAHNLGLQGCTHTHTHFLNAGWTIHTQEPPLPPAAAVRAADHIPLAFQSRRHTQTFYSRTTTPLLSCSLPSFLSPLLLLPLLHCPSTHPCFVALLDSTLPLASLLVLSSNKHFHTSRETSYVCHRRAYRQAH